MFNYSKVEKTSKEEYEKRTRQVYLVPKHRGYYLYTREAPVGIAVIVDKKEILNWVKESSY